MGRKKAQTKNYRDFHTMMATKTYRAKKTLLALGVLLASGLTVSQVQADQLADISRRRRKSRDI